MNYKNTFTIVSILVITGIVTAFVSTSERIPPNKSFSDFPNSIGEFKGKKGELDQEIYNILGVEDYILSNYVNESGQTVNLYVGYYQSQKQGDIIHSPKNCLPGSGWKIIQTAQETVQIPTQKKTIKVIKLLLQKESENQIVLYWFQSRGRIIASEYMQKLWLVVDSITKHRTDGSFVRLIAPVTKSQAQTVELLKRFAGEIYPILTHYIPS